MSSLSLALPGEVCPCSARHQPPARVIDTHHVLPVSWGGPDTPENRVRVCIQTHHTAHAVLNLYVHAGGPPPAAVLAGWPRYARALAARGWAARIPGHPTPYT